MRLCCWLKDSSKWDCWQVHCIQTVSLTVRVWRYSGDSEADEAARATLQGGDLLQSDMAAFKAANPACQLADFVRWHSPKDWQPDPSHPQGGHISDRMSHQVRLTYNVARACSAKHRL